MESWASENCWIVTDKSPVEVMRDIASQVDQDDPFYLLDVGNLVYKIQIWRRCLPRVEIFYAVKSNDHQDIIRVLSALGTGFDCATKTEIQKVLDIVHDASRIIYAHPCKSASDITFASDRRVSLMTFDCEEELHKVRRYYPSAKLVLRIRVDARCAAVSMGSKFGAEPEDCSSLLSTAQELGLQVVGVSFHVGSNCMEVDAYRRAIGAARQVFEEGKMLGMKLYLLDIGGGIPGEIGKDMEPFASVINSALETYFPQNDERLKIIAEPGRYVSASVCSLATMIRGTRTITSNNAAVTMYHINDGVFGSFGSAKQNGVTTYSPAVLLDKSRDEKEEPKENEESIVVGPTCSGFDVVRENLQLPRLQSGDWLYWPNMGAYCLVKSSDFNGFPKASVYVMASTDTLRKIQLGRSIIV